MTLDSRCCPLPSLPTSVLSLLQLPFFLCPTSLSLAYYRSRMTMLSLSFPHYFGVCHTNVAFCYSCPCFYLYYHPLPQLCDPFRNNRSKCRCPRD
ncbi:hypothetical protein BHE74_00003812 [Ensete ventricosum]|nr:hypothetical protein BHE74_00003812 [Ensete ventricosum]